MLAHTLPAVVIPPGAPALDEDLAAIAPTRCTWCGSDQRNEHMGQRAIWYRCRECGLWIHSLLADPLQDYGEDDYGDDYQTHLYGRDGTVQRKVRTAQYRVRELEIVAPRRGTLLDIGCSYGYLLDAARGRGWSVCGVDVAPQIVQLGAEQGFDVRLGSTTDVPFEDESVDAIYARHVLEHDIHTYRSLREFMRVLRPGGTLVIEVPCADHRRARKDPDRFVKDWTYLHMVTFTGPTLRGFVTRAGFVELPQPRFRAGEPRFMLWQAWRRFRRWTGQATYLVTWWRKPED